MPSFLRHMLHNPKRARCPQGISPDADIPHDLVVSGSKDCSVKVWNMNQPCVTAVLTCHGHTACVNCVAVSENIVASAADDCSVRVWDSVTGHCIHTLCNLGDWVKFVRLWQKDITLLYATDNTQLGLWSVKQGEILSSVNLADTRNNNYFSMTPGVQGAVLRGKTALVLTHCNGLFAWENKCDGSNIVHNFSLIGSHSNSVQRGECLAMHGALVAVGTRSGAVYLYHLDGNWENQFTKVHHVLHEYHDPVNAVCLGDDGEGPSLITGGDDGIVRVYRWFPPGI